MDHIVYVVNGYAANFPNLLFLRLLMFMTSLLVKLVICIVQPPMATHARIHCAHTRGWRRCRALDVSTVSRAAGSVHARGGLRMMMSSRWRCEALPDGGVGRAGVAMGLGMGLGLGWCQDQDTTPRRR